MIEARGSRQAILRAYNLFADFYGFWSALFEEKALTRGLALANVLPGERVLEVAVGPGTVVGPAKSAGRRIRMRSGY